MARVTTTGRPRSGPAAALGPILAVSLVALTTANCSKGPPQFAGAAPGGNGIDPKYGVKASPRLYNEGDVIPRGGGRRFSGKPYVVAGRTYVPRTDASGYVREGLASWYGSAFHGRMTANGEIFDRASIAAAHPTLPLPSYVRVTNLANSHSMVVRVNDRGPYHADRVLDVSEEVARALDFHRKGTSRVRVEYVGRASLAGSDDRRLLATLRTDGRPAGGGSVMVADLGPNAPAEVERYARPARPALAFRPPEEAEPARDIAEAPPTRPRPILVASGASVTVPAAVQPTAQRVAAFRPPAGSEAEAGSGAAHNASRAAIRASDRPAPPLNLAPPPIRLAAAGPGRTAPAGGKDVAALPSRPAVKPGPLAAVPTKPPVTVAVKTLPAAPASAKVAAVATPPGKAVAAVLAKAPPPLATARSAPTVAAAAKPGPGRAAPAGPAAKVAAAPPVAARPAPRPEPVREAARAPAAKALTAKVLTAKTPMDKTPMDKAPPARRSHIAEAR